jgi:hypothetical protein
MDKIEIVARAMAAADGYDPDKQVSGGSDSFITRSIERTGYDMIEYGPRWMAYKRQANLFIAGFEALKEIVE